MRKDAEAHAEEDSQRKELIEARNSADNMAYAAEKAIKDQAEKIPAQLKAEMESLISESAPQGTGLGRRRHDRRHQGAGRGHPEDRRRGT